MQPLANGVSSTMEVIEDTYQKTIIFIEELISGYPNDFQKPVLGNY